MGSNEGETKEKRKEDKAANVIGVVFWVARRMPLSRTDRMVIVNAAAGITAACTANLIVFRLEGIVLLLYLCVAGTSGSICGKLGAKIVDRIQTVVTSDVRTGKGEYCNG